MAVVSIPGNEPWIVARWAFRQLLESSADELAAAADRQELEQAVALDGLLYDLLPADQAGRIAVAMTSAAESLRSDLLQHESSDPRDAEFAEMLLDLIAHLADWSETRGVP